MYLPFLGWGSKQVGNGGRGSLPVSLNEAEITQNTPARQFSLGPWRKFIKVLPAIKRE